MTRKRGATPTPAELADESDHVVDYASQLHLAGRHFVVLGGGQGMGRQVSHALTQVEATITVVDADAERAARVCAEIGSAASPASVDATNDSQMSALSESVGDIDGVIDVIGMARYGSLVESSDETWDWEHDIVLKHAWLTIRHFGKQLAQRGAGSLTFVSSVSGIGSSPQHGAYGAFKAGLMSLVRTAAVELGPSGVRVNAVAPGFVLTPRMAQALNAEGVERAMSAASLQRLTLPADIAGGLLFLVSDLAQSINGHTLIIDGGATAKYPYDMSGF